MSRQGRLLCRSVFLPGAPSLLATQQGCHSLVVPPMGDPQGVEEECWLGKNEGLPVQGGDGSGWNVSRTRKRARAKTCLESARN